MSTEFQAFQDFIQSNDKNTKSYKNLINVVKEYSYLYFTDTLEQKLTISQNMSKSRVIMINHYKNESIKSDELHFIIVFQKTVLIIRSSLLPNLQSLFRKKDKLKICFFEDTKNIFDESIKIKYEESKKNEFFSEEISMISKEFFNNNGEFQYKKFLDNIKLCISGYLIQESYLKTNYDREKEFYSNEEIIPRTMNEKELIELRKIGTGSSFQAVLYYHIYDEKLYVIKKPNSCDPEIEKLLKREQYNYTKIKHSLIPKYYGTIYFDTQMCLIIEFINGKSLSSLDCSQFSLIKEIVIILKLLLVIGYLHVNNFIYRDMKPDNVIIDENENPVVIDFDRMIENKNINNENNDIQTIDFGSIFCAPEVNDKNLTNKCDIYSIGKMINKIMPDIEYDEYYSIIKPIYHSCIDKNPKNRPIIIDIYCLFLIFFDINFNSLKFMSGDPEIQYKIGIIYYEGEYIPRDINESIYYLSLASNQNHLKAQFKLGLIYYEGEYISRDINKSIYYFTMAANQNNPEAQYNLGSIYYEGKYISRDINKAIYYFSFAANQNDPYAQFNLGVIYEEGQYIPRDINKAIYYYSLAANQNHPQAQYNLGSIYYKGQYISRDINKSIYYFSLAVNQNDPKAQFILGVIYEAGQYISRDINKAIYYYSLAANQNYPQAQLFLGNIYYLGQYISRDINKAIYYYSLAANQNIPKAQLFLGQIYYLGQDISQDINKSFIYYSLAVNQNIPEAQYDLGLIYYSSQYISRDINKAIYYFERAANQNHPNAQFYLGLIYYEGKYITQNMTKSIYYFTLAAKHNYPQAQYNLGVFYFNGIGIKQNIKKAIYWFTQSSNNDYIKAHFVLGFLYQEGKYIKRNIEESIKYYKKASSFNNQYAKNNLGIIYKNNIEKKYDYTVYFEEAIRQKNDPVSMYNLSHSYIYEYKEEKLINKSIELLIKSIKLGFKPSTKLLCIMLIKTFFSKQNDEYGIITYENIEQELSKFTDETSEIIYSIFNIIEEQQLYNHYIFEHYYNKYEKVEFIYDFQLKPICIQYLYKEENELKQKDSYEVYNISTDFYEGFGYDIYN